MTKHDDFKLFSDSSDDESDAFLPNVSNTSTAGKSQMKLIKTLEILR